MGEPALAPAQRRLLDAVLDEIVPARPDLGAAALPGAGGLGLGDAIERALERSPELRPALVQGLDALAGRLREAGAAGLEALADGERAALLEALAAEQPAFLPGLVFQTYVAYYQHPRVLEALGIPGRPPHPGGYELERGDFAIFEVVRRRGPPGAVSR